MGSPPTCVGIRQPCCNAVKLSDLFWKGDMNTTTLGKRVSWAGGAAVAIVSALSLMSACSRDAQALTPQQLQQQYGITDSYTGQVTTPDGALRGTLVPVTLPDGRTAQLVIPNRRSGEPHAAYLSDDQGLHPIELQPNVTRAQVVSSPVVASRRTERAHPQQRSWEKELLIIGGSAGAGAGVGALTGGKKGAGIGAGVGGVGGLIYDLATRKNP
jgi:hypothetical protein